MSSQSLSEILEKALDQWEKITGAKLGESSFQIGNFDLSSMNRTLKQSLELDPEGVTTYLMLECFLRRYLESKAFTAAEIMKDYEANSKYFMEAEKLFSIVQSEFALSIAAEFRAKVLAAIKQYGADRDDVVEMVNDLDVLPFLRRDALFSLENLQAFQFLKGEPSNDDPKVINNVFIAWDINQMLLATRDMQYSGVGVVLMRDPAHPDRSYFVFTIRNGENVTILTDKNRPVYPGQEDVLARRGSRGIGRTFEQREHANHFPYQLIKMHYDDNDDVVFEEEKFAVRAGLELAPLMRISDLEPHQVIWVTMMTSLISEKFWKSGWQAKELSYTGAMVTNKELLIADNNDRLLPVSKGYQKLPMKAMKPEDVTSENVTKELDLKRDGKDIANGWMEERYAKNVPEELLNQWVEISDKTSEPITKMLPNNDDNHSGFRNQEKKDVAGVSEGEDGITRVEKDEKRHFWDNPSGYQLNTFSQTEFGTEKELMEDAVYIARHNLAMFIQKEADNEYKETSSKIVEWYIKAARKNLPNLLKKVAEYEDKKEKTLIFGEHKSETFGRSGFGISWGHNLSDSVSGQDKYYCVINNSVATYRALFEPRGVDDIAMVTGIEKSKLPDVLQYWHKDRHYRGNHLLNRLDPLETIVNNPWMKMRVGIEFHLSKRAYNQLVKQFK